MNVTYTNYVIQIWLNIFVLTNDTKDPVKTIFKIKLYANSKTCGQTLPEVILIIIS